MANVTVRTTGSGTLTTTTTYGLDEVTFNAAAGANAIKNYFAYSQNLTFNNTWGNGGGVVTYPGPLYTAPNGTQTAYRVAEDTSATAHYLGTNVPQSIILGAYYTGSIYLKQGPSATAPSWMQITFQYQFCNSEVVNFNLSTGTIGTNSAQGASMVAVGNGWYRCSMTFLSASSGLGMGMWISFINNSNTSGRLPAYQGSGMSDVLVWGGQFEQSAAPTPYQATGVAGTILPINWANKAAPDAVFTTGDLDEVTYNVNSGVTKNLLVNSNWLGGTSGAWGGGSATLPTGWVGTPTSGAVTFAPAQSGTGNNITFFGVQARDYLSQYPAFNIAPNTNYVFSVQIEAIPVPEQPADIFLIVGSYQYNFNYSFYFNGVSVYAYTPLTTPGLLSVVFSNPGYIPASAGSALMRVGFGTSGFDAAGGIRLANPQVEVGSTATIYQPTTATGTAPVAFARRDTAQGNIFVGGNFDEFSGGINTVTSGLIYQFDPAKYECYPGQGTAVYDATKNYAPGTLVGAATYSTDYGGVINLDGNSGYIDTGIVGNTAQFYPTSSFTFSIWAKFSVPNPNLSRSGTATLFGCFSYSGVGIAYQGSGSTTTIYGAFGTVRTNLLELGNYFQLYPTLGVWTNYVFCYSYANGINQTYQNGVLISSGPLSPGGTYNTGSQTISIGSNNPESGGVYTYFPGQIGQALLYNRALTSAEVGQNFNDIRGRYGV